MRIFWFLFFTFLFQLLTNAAFARGVAARNATNLLSSQCLKAARQAFAQKQLFAQVSRGLVQVSRLGAKVVLGTGFVFRSRNRLWVAMPYHIGGVAGSRRVIRFAGENNVPLEREISIVANGNAGWHAPDVSLAEFPGQDVRFVDPIPLGAPRLDEEAYSFGYVSGRVSALDEILPVKRHFFSAEGFGLIADRQISGEDFSAPYNISGYCGSPVMQQINGTWRAVGLHTGSCIAKDGSMRSFAVNLYRVIPLLLNRYLEHKSGYSRDLVFRGWQLDKLLPSERVFAVEVWRNGACVFRRLLRNFPAPYSDEHSELALADFELNPRDEIRYNIHNNQRETRFVSYVLP